jgi:predicted nucleic-acid-binding Zn-ribbon protein
MDHQTATAVVPDAVNAKKPRGPNKKKEWYPYPDEPQLTRNEIAVRVLTDPKWQEARAAWLTHPMSIRKISGKRACAGRNDTCRQIPVGDSAICGNCVVRLYGFKQNNGGTPELEFIVRCMIVHQGKYDYTNTKYINNDACIEYSCQIHKKQDTQTAGNHLKGSGCPKCGSHELDTDEFVTKAKAVHGDEHYDYSNVIYKHTDSAVTIRCRIHNIEFTQAPAVHLRGYGCNTCGRIASTEGSRKDTPYFIAKALLAHSPGRYLYHLVEYYDCGLNVTIVCGRCKREFLQTPSNHYAGKGCSRCRESKLEAIASRVFKDLKIVSETQTTFDGCVGTCRLLRFDAVVCNKQLLIELDGLQHFQTSKNWNGDEGYRKRLKHDNIKDTWCRANNKILLRISHVDIKNMKELIEHALHWLENQPPDVHGGYILATKFYTTFNDRDTSKYIILD